MRTNVVITGVGGGVGQSIIKCLRGSEYRTIGVDIFDNAAGLYLADEAFLGKPASHPGFIDHLLKVCRATGARYLFPGLDVELAPIAANRDAFRAIGTTPIVSDPAVIHLSDNKLALCRYLVERGMTAIPTYTSLKSATASPGPYIIKPATGCRSQGVRKIDTLAGESLRADEIVQAHIAGDEYTCGSVSFDGAVLGVIAMRRQLRDGDTYKAVVEQNPAVIGFVTQLLRDIRPFGPCNVQCREQDGRVYTLEINARCSGTTAARMHAGFNEPRLTLDHLEGRPTAITIDPIEVSRYWNEVVIRTADKARVRVADQL